MTVAGGRGRDDVYDRGARRTRMPDGGKNGTPGDRYEISQWDRKVLPVLVSAAIIAYYVRELEWSRLWESAERANMWVAFTALAVPQLLAWFIGALIVVKTLVWFHGPFPMREYFWVRGAAYILAFVNSALQGGGLLLYQKRKAEIGWPKLFGLILFRTGLIYWSIGLFMIPATLLLHYHGLAHKAFGSTAALTAWWIILLVPGFLFLLSNFNFWFRGRDLTGLGGFIVRNRQAEFWTAFANSRPRHWFLVWIMFLPEFVLVVVGFQVLNLTFGIDVPWIEAIVLLPFAFLIMDLPIAFGGYGTMTLAWMTLFEDYGTPESITALTLFVPTARILVRAVIGAVSLKPALTEIDQLLKPAGEGERPVIRLNELMERDGAEPPGTETGPATAAEGDEKC
jgi:hypothetical protein